MSVPLQDGMMGLHAQLEQRFHAHQVALLDRDFERAGSELDAYRERLFAHMIDEEERVLPHYRDLGGDATDAPVRLFTGEHARMREFVLDCLQRTRGLAARPDDRDLLALFDREATYKNLVLHHDLRERNVLYPFLGARIAEPAQRELFASMRWRGEA
ncbi:MAG: hemerythrin domain-containing protein [Planctomycetes bacterium]|nr:hemerythrin domain-containing protein [Planctomycetota bacterium]MCB9884004.1 hemerythrin domain-containing protein [Planctomycetota bacterium]